jgi:SAM-dependent methyltransferase
MHKVACRVCKGHLAHVLDLGMQVLGGQFPKLGEPDPPSAPICLSRCDSCGLVQLSDTVDPELMFRDYGYRSGVTATMRGHLTDLAIEAVGMLGKPNPRILDIGGNDGTLLRNCSTSDKFLIDPANMPDNPDGVNRCQGFFPQDVPADWKDFDLIFTVACFYDADDPVAFAQAVAQRLKPDGIWCVEVADAVKMAQDGGWDAICHEHLCYYDYPSFHNICSYAGLEIIRQSRNDCNGGSLRFHARRRNTSCFPVSATHTYKLWCDFADAVERSKEEIATLLLKYTNKRVHLLGASTKANTWLQAVGVTPRTIQFASDRDPRKVGRMTPGTHIPIISEEESRALNPDVYIVGPWQFEKEIVEREQDFLKRGGKLVFPLPKPHEVSL